MSGLGNEVMEKELRQHGYVDHRHFESPMKCRCPFWGVWTPGKE